MTSPAKKLKIELPDSERGRSPDDLRRFEKLRRKLLRSGLTDKEIERLQAELAAVENAPEEREDDKWRRRAEAETLSIALGRGEQVAAEGASVKRILDRDPLLSLARAGVLTDRQLEVGQAVRDLYDLRMGDAASAPFDGTPAGTHDHERFVGNRFLRAKASVPAGQLETAILNGHFRTTLGTLYQLTCWPKLKAAGMEPHISLRALRWVCCEHNTLTSMGRGRAYERNRKGLCFALDVADEVLDGRAGARAAEVAARTGSR